MLTERAHQYAQQSQWRGAMDDADLYGRAGSPGGGPYFQLWIKLAPLPVEDRALKSPPSPPSPRSPDQVIQDQASGNAPTPQRPIPPLQTPNSKLQTASYETHGCPSSMAVGGLLCALLTGRTLEQAQLIERKDIELLIGPLPEGKEFCYDLGIEALREAVQRSQFARRSHVIPSEAKGPPH